MRILTLQDISHSKSQISIIATLDDLRFSTAIWYKEVDLNETKNEVGEHFFEKMLFHIAAFEINKICSLKPERICWGKYSEFATPQFEALWKSIFRNVWAQWRFENNITDYYHPEFDVIGGPDSVGPISRNLQHQRSISFFAGGKDSLVSAKILNEVGEEFDVLSYSASYYGTLESQMSYIRASREFVSYKEKIEQYVFDDFLDCPVLSLEAKNGVGTLTAAETPSSVFGALPFVLSKRATSIVLAHERSADKEQVYWKSEDENVNHQWGKSYEAEALINNYIRENLISDFTYFSSLKPIYDVAIFNKLREFEEAVPFTHSCNVKKPWCMRCPKCAYVWLGYVAFLSSDTISKTFGDENLLDVDELSYLFRQLVGLEDQLPFECIGEADEARLFMFLAAKRGYHGTALEACSEALTNFDPLEIAERYLEYSFEQTAVPEHLISKMETVFKKNSESALLYIRRLCSH